MFPDEEGESPVTTFVETYKWPLLLGIGSTLCIVIAIILLFRTTQTAEPIQFSNVESSSSAHAVEIMVDIEGAVGKPGVYRLPNGSRIEDLLTLAGGLTDDADSVWVGKSLNRAALLLDGGKLYIPKISEAVSSERKESNTDSFQSTGISINTATAKELDTLPGVGEVTAQKIIDGRPYQTIEELRSRNIVGQSVFEKIKDQLTL